MPEASTKDIFEAEMFSARIFASGIFRGGGAEEAGVTGPFFVAAMAIHDAGIEEAAVVQ